MGMDCLAAPVVAVEEAVAAVAVAVDATASRSHIAAVVRPLWFYPHNGRVFSSRPHNKLGRVF